MSLHAIAKSWSSECPRRLGMAILVALCTLLASRTASGHQASITHSTVDVSRDQTELTYRIKFDPPDVAEALGLGVDQNPSDQQVMRGQGRLLGYVLDRVHVTNGDHACPVEPLGAQVVTQGGRFVEASWQVRCPEPFHTLVVEYNLFFELDPLHRNLLQVNYRGERALAELKSGEARFVWELDEPPPDSRLGFIVSGIEHIAFGFDHIAFLLGLLLVVAIRRADPGGQRRTFELRPLGKGLRYTAAIVTSFTLAHSITLIAASLDWIALNTRVVESAIAASIVYVAVDNIVRPDPPYRYLVTFGFGLVHGLGFASVLKVLLPAEDVIWPLLLFNVGVELGQLAVVIVVLPLLHLFARVMSARWYREWLLPVGSGILALLGTIWLVERVFDVVLLGL